MNEKAEAAFRYACEKSGLDESDDFVRRFGKALRDGGKNKELLLGLPVEARRAIEIATESEPSHED